MKEKNNFHENFRDILESLCSYSIFINSSILKNMQTTVKIKALKKLDLAKILFLSKLDEFNRNSTDIENMIKQILSLHLLSSEFIKNFNEIEKEEKLKAIEKLMFQAKTQGNLFCTLLNNKKIIKSKNILINKELIVDLERGIRVLHLSQQQNQISFLNNENEKEITSRKLLFYKVEGINNDSNELNQNVEEFCQLSLSIERIVGNDNSRQSKFYFFAKMPCLYFLQNKERQHQSIFKFGIFSNNWKAKNIVKLEAESLQNKLIENNSLIEEKNVS